ncbi:MAG TPA: filamentous hemagglutinin family protein, partial [Geobacteraceae bacterium]|nr:filamentous hemagglutinin family protein [Geobacteraceae bacterium]
EIDLLARNNLTLASGSQLLANATGANGSGGEVYLKAGDVAADASGLNHAFGSLNVNGGALIDVSGSGTGSGGTAYFRAMRNDANNDVLMQVGAGATVKGAAAVDLEAVKVYTSPTGDLGTDFDASTNGTLYKDTAAFAGTEQFTSYDPASLTTVTAGSFTDTLSGLTALAGYRLLPGIEIRGNGPLALTGSDWDFSSWRPGVGGSGVAPGVLTLRSGGDLTIGANLADYSSSAPYMNVNDWSLRKENAAYSWGFNLVAGADLAAGDPMGIANGSAGKLTISDPANQAMVYTENAPIRFASAGDTFINADDNNSLSYAVYNYMPVTLGTFNGNITGKVGGNLYLNSGVIQSGTGNIDLTVKGEVDLSQIGGTGYGAIRTTGQPAAFDANADLWALFQAYWNYGEGGNISIDAKGSIWGWNSLDPLNRTRDGAYTAANAWDMVTYSSDDNAYKWSANYGSSDPHMITQGIAAMGGGSVDIRSGKDIATQAGAFGAGDLRMFAAGDAFGRYLVNNGTGDLVVMGNIGAQPVFGKSAYVPTYRQPTIEMMNDSTVNATAFGAMSLGAVLDPMLANSAAGWVPSYGTKAAVNLTALGGGVSLLGQMYDRPASGNLSGIQILPQSVEIASAGDITFYVDTYLAPSAIGNLQLFSGGSIASASSSLSTAATLKMLQMLDNDVFYTTKPLLQTGVASHPPDEHGASPDDANKPLHWGDSQPVVIKAKEDIDGLRIATPKETEISAGRDIYNAVITSQNIDAGDVSYVTAGRDLIMTRNPGATYVKGNLTTDYSGIEVGGPGYVFIMAGDSIDLGNSQGLRTVGNAFNELLDSSGSSLVMAAGSAAVIPHDQVTSFFKALRTDGDAYSTLLANGDTAGAQATIEDTRATVIEPFLKGFSSTGGSISMVQSQISTTSPGADIYIIAMKDIDVGRSALNQSNAGSTGIFTDKGGAINIYSGGDLNVNVSRVMTFFGGDITAWSDSGNINAGRGSKTAISAQPPYPRPQYDSGGNLIGYKLEFNPPSVGSGIRAVTYDPNIYPGEGLAIPDPGDIHLFAPQGVIDAGEAGIAGGKVFLGATEVLNSKNISFSAGSVGVPSASEGSVSLGALAGAGSVTDTGKMIEQSSSLGASKDKLNQAATAVDDFMSKWLDVKVVSFDDDSDDAVKQRKKEMEKEQRKKHETL